MSSFTAFPDDSEFLDALPLDEICGDGFDDFEGLLGDNCDVLSTEENDVSSTEFELEELHWSMERLSFIDEGLESIEEFEREEQPQPQHNQNDRRVRHVPSRSPSPPRKRFHCIDPLLVEASSSDMFEPLPFDNPSHDDVSMCSYATAPASSNLSSQNCRRSSDVGSASTKSIILNSHRPNRRSSDTSCFSDSPTTQAQYAEALEKLAQSMRRTEESRKQLLAQRELERKTAERSIGTSTSASRQRALSSERSSVLTAFFSGSRTTLTSGLEQSRRQLRAYMHQINNQAL